MKYIPEALRDDNYKDTNKPVSVEVGTETIKFVVNRDSKNTEAYVISKNDIRNIFGSL